jgi:hypothetical protein
MATTYTFQDLSSESVPVPTTVSPKSRQTAAASVAPAFSPAATKAAMAAFAGNTEI